MRSAVLALALVGCALSHEVPGPSCWYSGTQTDAPDRAHCFDTFDECTEHAAMWAGDPWACE